MNESLLKLAEQQKEYLDNLTPLERLAYNDLMEFILNGNVIISKDKVIEAMYGKRELSIDGIEIKKEKK